MLCHPIEEKYTSYFAFSRGEEREREQEKATIGLGNNMRFFIPLLWAAASMLLPGTMTIGDGDLAQLYYRFMDSSLEFPQLNLTLTTTESKRIVEYLAASSLAWDELPGLLQRAVLWEFGYVETAGEEAAFQQVYVKCGQPMASIALTKDQSGLEQDELMQCGMRFQADYSDSSEPSLFSAMKCATRPVETTSYGTFWANGAPSDVPTPKLHRYDGGSWQIYTIHTSANTLRRGCDSVTTAIIPCGEYIAGGWCVPQPRSELRARLQLFAKDRPVPKTSAPTENPGESSASPTSNENKSNPDGKDSNNSLVIILGAVAGVIAVCLLLFFIHRRRNKPVNEVDSSTMEPKNSPAERLTDMIDSDQMANTATLNRSPSTEANTTSLSLAEVCRLSDVLDDFFSSSAVNLRRLDYSSLTFVRSIARGAYGEVWYGTCDGKEAALKCLVQHRARDIEELEKFSEEIRLMCKFEHPNINVFYGVAWNDVQDLCVVSAYAANGDLRNFLVNNHPRELTWKDQKLAFAIDVGGALIYLHSLQPKVIHRDLKSKNILISDKLRAMLADFGSSRERSIDETMTAGVGTVRWTAPEVLRGARYSEKADIYAYGAVLTELDTHMLPYETQLNAYGNKCSEVEIATRVITEGLRPSFSAGCPTAIYEIGLRCLENDEEKRPTALEIVYHLRSKVFPKL